MKEAGHASLRHLATTFRDNDHFASVTPRFNPDNRGARVVGIHLVQDCGLIKSSALMMS